MDVVAFLFGLGLGGGGIAFVAFGGSKLRTALAIRSSDPVTVRQLAAAESPLEFEGTVELPPDEEPLETAYSGTAAVLHEYRERERRSSESRSSWQTVESGGDRRPFIVSDESGRAEVDPKAASFEGTWETVDTEGIIELFGGKLSISGSLGGQLGIGPRSRKYQERGLKPGDSVHVYGGQTIDRGGGWDRDVDVTVGVADDSRRYQLTDGTEEAAYRQPMGSGIAISAFGVLLAAFGVLTLIDAF